MRRAPEVYKRGNTWCARYVDAAGITRRSTLGVRVGAVNESALIQQALAALLSGVPKGGSGGSGGMTLDEAYRKADREHWAQMADRRNIAGRWEDVKAFFGASTPIASLTASKIGEFKAHLLGRGNSPKTVNRKLSVLSKLLHLAADDWEVIDRIPTMKRFKEKRGRVRWVTEAEEATLIAFFEAGAGGCKLPGGYGGGMVDGTTVPREGAQDMADLVAVLIDTGMRLGEALRAQDRDVTPSGIYIAESKGDAQRTVPLTPRAAAILARRTRRDREAHARLAGSSKPFGNIDGDRAGKLWALARNAMGLELDDEFVIHALRHAFAVRMVEAEQDVRVIQYLMGHRKVETTTIYAHVSNRAAQRAVDAVQRVRAGVPDSAPILSVVPGGRTGT